MFDPLWYWQSDSSNRYNESSVLRVKVLGSHVLPSVNTSGTYRYTISNTFTCTIFFQVLLYRLILATNFETSCFGLMSVFLLYIQFYNKRSYNFCNFYFSFLQPNLMPKILSESHWNAHHHKNFNLVLLPVSLHPSVYCTAYVGYLNFLILLTKILIYKIRNIFFRVFYLETAYK